MKLFKSDLQKINLNNLLNISKLFKKYNFFIFYGTLLGIVRDGNIIKYDDDIDILIDVKDKEKVLSEISNQNIYKINEINSNEYFVQLNKKDGDIISCVDLYFYINNPDNNYIIEKHNFLSFIENPKYSIHIPKDLIFPLQESRIFENVKLPNNGEKLCEFLYGKNWKLPIRKNSGYRMEIINNKPKLIKRSKIGSLFRYLKYKISNQFKKTNLN